jgi:hypothetical protein
MAKGQGKILVEPGARGSRLRVNARTTFGGGLSCGDLTAYPISGSRRRARAKTKMMTPNPPEGISFSSIQAQGKDFSQPTVDLDDEQSNTIRGRDEIHPHPDDVSVSLHEGLFDRDIAV